MAMAYCEKVKCENAPLSHDVFFYMVATVPVVLD